MNHAYIHLYACTWPPGQSTGLHGPPLDIGMTDHFSVTTDGRTGCPRRSGGPRRGEWAVRPTRLPNRGRRAGELRKAEGSGIWGRLAGRGIPHVAGRLGPHARRSAQCVRKGGVTRVPPPTEKGRGTLSAGLGASLRGSEAGKWRDTVQIGLSWGGCGGVGGGWRRDGPCCDASGSVVLSPLLARVIKKSTCHAWLTVNGLRVQLAVRT